MAAKSHSSSGLTLNPPLPYFLPFSVVALLRLAPPTQNFNLSVSHKASDWLPEDYVIPVSMVM